MKGYWIGSRLLLDMTPSAARVMPVISRQAVSCATGETMYTTKLWSLRQACHLIIFGTPAHLVEPWAHMQKPAQHLGQFILIHHTARGPDTCVRRDMWQHMSHKTLPCIVCWFAATVLSGSTGGGWWWYVM
jgi:hypothetical protein